MADFKVQFAETGKTFPVAFAGEGKQFKASMGETQVVTVGAEPYEGDYTVVPKVNAQTMETKDKIMQDDVTVMAIPYYDVSNTAGGSTVYIGNDSEMRL